MKKRKLKWEPSCQRWSRRRNAKTNSQYLNQREAFQPISLPMQKQRGRLSGLRGITAGEIKPKMNSPPLLLEEPQSLWFLPLEVGCFLPRARRINPREAVSTEANTTFLVGWVL